MRHSKLILALGIFILTAPGMAYAGITMSLDRSMLDFRSMDVGETKELADQGAYHNQIT